MCTDRTYANQASPDSDNEKKGRERDGKREKDLEKEKENDKSRGKPRSDSKQKSPKRKAAKEEVGCHGDWGSHSQFLCLRPLKSVFLIWSAGPFQLFGVAFRAAGIRQAASWVKGSWRRGGELCWNNWMLRDSDHSSLLRHAFPSCPSACTGHAALEGQLTHICRCAAPSTHVHVHDLAFLDRLLFGLAEYSSGCHFLLYWIKK